MDLLCNGNVVQTKTMTVDCQPLSSVVIENPFKVNDQDQECAVTVYLKKNNEIFLCLLYVNKSKKSNQKF